MRPVIIGLASSQAPKISTTTPGLGNNTATNMQTYANTTLAKLTAYQDLAARANAVKNLQLAQQLQNVWPTISKQMNQLSTLGSLYSQSGLPGTTSGMGAYNQAVSELAKFGPLGMVAAPLSTGESGSTAAQRLNEIYKNIKSSHSRSLYFSSCETPYFFNSRSKRSKSWDLE
jgi:hypothetical protein